MMDQEMPR